MRVDHRGGLYTAKTGQTDWTQIETDPGTGVEGVPDTGFSRGFMQFAPKIVEAVREGRASIEHAATFEDGRSVQKVLDAARQSNESGNTVSVR
jgi:predicted dehydrogenase